MTKYMIVLNGIIEADSEIEAIQIFKESAEYGDIECFKCEDGEQPWDESEIEGGVIKVTIN